MGMFDYLRCEFPLPAPDAQDIEYQTKDTPSQYMDHYVIKADGFLWGEEYDIEDRSATNAEGLMKIVGMATRVNHRPIKFGTAFIEQDLRAADQAVMSGDIVAMIAAYNKLKEIEA